MQEHLNHILQGGNVDEVRQMLVADEIGFSPGSEKFKTPQIDNVFDVHSEFKQSSAGVRGFNADDKSEPDFLRRSSSLNKTRDSKKMTSPVRKKAAPKDTPTNQIQLNNKKPIFHLDLEEAELERDEAESFGSPTLGGTMKQENAMKERLS